MGTTVYKSVTAAGDVFCAPENIVIFGNIFTGVPTAEVDGFTVTVTDTQNNTIYTRTATLAQ